MYLNINFVYFDFKDDFEHACTFKMPLNRFCYID